MEALAISRSGLDVEWQRLQVIARNIANANTTHTGQGEPYRAVRLISGPTRGFAEVAGRFANAAAPAGGGVMVYGLAAEQGGIRRSHEPAHPLADADGFVTRPAVSQATEMSLMIRTTRGYEANLVALAAAQKMYSSALQLGRQG